MTLLHMPRLAAALWAVVLLFSAAPAIAQLTTSTPPPSAAPAGPAAIKEAAPFSLPPDSVTRHTALIAGERLSYTATAGSLPLAGPKGDPLAKVFYVSYTRDSPQDNRPVTFVFNGGPGAAAAFLHLGAMGPRVINFNENGAAPEEPVRMADNPDSWLSFTDMVFIDPVGTGFSRPTAEGEEAERAFYGVEKDANAMADFVRLYLSRNERSLSPVYLAGESYGGFRAVLVAKRLLGSGLQVKGTVLISPALEFAILRGDEYTLLPTALVLPSIAAAHTELRDGIGAPLDGLAEVETFARTGYLLHLAAGRRHDDGVIGLLERYTGLDTDTLTRHHGRVSRSLFLREYTRKKDIALSPYDATVSIPVPRPSEHNSVDPVLDRAMSVLTPAMTQYARQELGYRTDLPYRLLNRDISGKWDFGTTPNRQGFADALDELQQARTHNPGLKVLITHGYTDLVTPYGVSQFLIDQLRPIEGAAPVTLKVYGGGHMMYTRAASRRQLYEDARELYTASTPPNG